jgi:hypothetical protein
MSLDDEFVEFVKSNLDTIIKNSSINIIYGIFTITFNRLYNDIDNLYLVGLCYSSYGELDYYFKYIELIDITCETDFNNIRLPYINAIRCFEEHKKIIEFLSNFGPIVKSKNGTGTFVCGDIIIVNNSDIGIFKFSHMVIKNIDDIMKYFPNIYKYQIIKDQKLVLQ